MFNFQHPYPSEEQKKQLAKETGLTILQVNNWYVILSTYVIVYTFRHEPIKKRGRKVYVKMV